jgi:hypothetical protein
MIISPYAYTLLYLKNSPESFELKPIVKKKYKPEYTVNINKMNKFTLISKYFT